MKMEENLVKIKKKIIVKDFINHFRNRYIELSSIIQENNNLFNLISINKISREKESMTIIGIVREKKITKKGHLMLSIEDLTGNINVIIPLFRSELFNNSLDICLDSIMSFSGVANNEIMFVEKILYPEASLNDRKKIKNDYSVMFIGDIHFGSKNFMKKEFSKLIEFLSEDNVESDNIKYLFIVGDLVAGVGIYPNQEEDLEINDLEEQFNELSYLLGKIRKDIQIIISPGNNDGVRLMEPQPQINYKYASKLRDMDNIKFVTNPYNKKIEEIDILIYHGFSFPYYANNIPSLLKTNSIDNPEMIMKYLLKNRHLAPVNISNQYFPSKEDKLLIRQVPDIFVCGHTHKSSITYENNILLISVSSWEKMTKYQEKMGNNPDFAKASVINLHTRAVKILDFNLKENLK